jgi:hypothetical protein
VIELVLVTVLGDVLSCGREVRMPQKEHRFFCRSAKHLAYNQLQIEEKICPHGMEPEPQYNYMSSDRG